MASISIDEAKARVWTDDVNAELEAVELVLKKVSGALTEVAGSDDSIMNGIYKTGTAMESAWTDMCNGFRAAQSLVTEGISIIFKGGAEVLDELGSLISKFGQ